MIDPIGDTQITPAARISGELMPSTAGSGVLQLGPILSMLVQEFGSYSSASQLAVLTESIRMVVSAGVPAVDLADSMYNNSAVLEALRDGNPETAKQATISQVSDAIAFLRGSAAPEASLQALSTAGFAASEIVYALRTVPGLREELMQGDMAQLRQVASSLHAMFRDNGRSIHDDPAMLAALGERVIPGLGGTHCSYFEQYLNRIGVAQMRSLGEVRPEDHPELMLAQPQMPGGESSESYGAWIIALVVGTAVLLVIVSRC